jgi:hypothetical protein
MTERAAPLLQQPTSQQFDDLERKLDRVSAAISIGAWIGFIFSVVALVVTGAVLFTSTTLSPDKKVFFVSILLVCTTALQFVVCVSRGEPIALLIFTQLSGFVSALALGLSITYAI